MKRSKGYPTDLTKSQKKYIRKKLPEIFKRRLKNSVFRILEAILYLVKSGCQWNMLPHNFPRWRCVYNHYRTWSDRGWFERLLKCLVSTRRMALGRSDTPTTAVVDSQSVKWGTIDSAKGIDGFKRIKGIKRHIAVDSCGYPLSVYISEANIHDSRAAYPLCGKLLADYHTVSLIKADNGYRGSLRDILESMFSVKLDCVKSNFGTSEFRPIEGRWVVERIFSWLESYRRMNRNYEKILRCSRNITIVACMLLMLKHIG